MWLWAVMTAQQVGPLAAPPEVLNSIPEHPQGGTQQSLRGSYAPFWHVGVYAAEHSST